VPALILSRRADVLAADLLACAVLTGLGPAACRQAQVSLRLERLPQL